MRQVAAALFACAVSLYAADFWQAKPPSEWTDKEVQKILNNSPWAKPMSVPLSAPSTSFGTAQGNSGVDAGVAPPISEGGGGGRGGRGGGGGAAAAASGGGPGGGSGIELVARWQSARPEKEAFVRSKYGAEASTSADAKQVLDRVEQTYVVILAGNLRPFMRMNPEGLKKILLDSTALAFKGKEPLRPDNVDVSPSQIIFVFPRTVPVTVDDKEVEFSTKLADIALKYKFRLKDMMFNGKLEL